ncbi:MAG TPA: hypothetical protein VJ798_06735 [Rhizomicrobium sp.]|nr:hypothetical protein [Rhizomicrobium sp.]
MKCLALVAALLLAAAPALAQKKPWPVAGIWFGSGQIDDRSQMYIDTFNPGGSFHAHHRKCAQGKVAYELFEAGRWRVVDNALTVDIATVNGRKEPRTDLYLIKSVDDKIQNYVHVDTNFEFRARKVNASFKMPPCDLSS